MSIFFVSQSKIGRAKADMKYTNRRYQQTMGKPIVYVRFKASLQEKTKDLKVWQRKPWLTTAEQEYFFQNVVSQ